MSLFSNIFNAATLVLSMGKVNKFKKSACIPDELYMVHLIPRPFASAKRVANIAKKVLLNPAAGGYLYWEDVHPDLTPGRVSRGIGQHWARYFSSEEFGQYARRCTAYSDVKSLLDHWENDVGCCGNASTAVVLVSGEALAKLADSKLFTEGSFQNSMTNLSSGLRKALVMADVDVPALVDTLVDKGFLRERYCVECESDLRKSLDPGTDSCSSCEYEYDFDCSEILKSMSQKKPRPGPKLFSSAA